MYKCKYCGEGFERATEVANHVKSVHKPVKYGTKICECCGKEVTAQGGAYKHHLNSCRKRKVPYICQTCGKEVTEWFGTGKFCSKKCANSRPKNVDEKEHLRIKSIEFLGFDFYINKLQGVLHSLIRKKTHQEYTKKIKSKNENHKCPICGEYYTGKSICKECADYKNYVDFKTGKIEVSFRVAKRLIEKYEGHKCSICGINEWCNKPIPLILDHIDGRAHNNTYTNLRLVCSNCDSQLPTYKSKNKHSDRKRKGWYH